MLISILTICINKLRLKKIAKAKKKAKSTNEEAGNNPVSKAKPELEPILQKCTLKQKAFFMLMNHNRKINKIRVDYMKK